MAHLFHLPVTSRKIPLQDNSENLCKGLMICAIHNYGFFPRKIGGSLETCKYVLKFKWQTYLDIWIQPENLQFQSMILFTVTVTQSINIFQYSWSGDAFVEKMMLYHSNLLIWMKSAEEKSPSLIHMQLLKTVYYKLLSHTDFLSSFWSIFLLSI